MTYTAPHGILTILGDAFAAAEIWQTGIRLVGTTPPTTAQFGTLNTAVQTFLSTAAVSFPVGRRYLGLKWAPQDIEGRYGESGEAVEWFRPTPLAGTGNVGFPQIACVLSLRTARPRGYASNGRMYIPSSAAVSATDGRLAAADATAIATAAATLMSSIRSSGAGNPAVMSAVGAGRTELVTGVRVGRVMDTMRSRRNGLDEAYVAPIAVP